MRIGSPMCKCKRYSKNINSLISEKIGLEYGLAKWVVLCWFKIASLSVGHLACERVESCGHGVLLSPMVSPQRPADFSPRSPLRLSQSLRFMTPVVSVFPVAF